jgi:hypothetical protein
MTSRITAVLVALVLALTLIACSPDSGTGSGVPPVDGGASGLRLAPGLYDLEDGTVQAIGTLEYRELEGGFWAIIGGTEGDGNLGEVAAVISNADEFADELEVLEGRTVSVLGTRFEGASIRMAGPEITVTSIEEISDTPGAAE